MTTRITAQTPRIPVHSGTSDIMPCGYRFARTGMRRVSLLKLLSILLSTRHLRDQLEYTLKHKAYTIHVYLVRLGAIWKKKSQSQD